MESGSLVHLLVLKLWRWVHGRNMMAHLWRRNPKDNSLACMAKGERSPKALAQFAHNVCKDGNFWLLLRKQFGIIGNFSSASMLWDDSRCARWEPIGTSLPMETMVEEYNTLRSGCLQTRNINPDIYTEDGWICSEMRACSCCFGLCWCYRCVRRQTASKISLDGLLSTEQAYLQLTARLRTATSR